MQDASNPKALTVISRVHAVAGYIGGDTPNIWPDNSSGWKRKEFTGLKKLPIFVRSTVVGASGGKADAFTALESLYALSVPHGSAVIYDRESNTDTEATAAFNEVMQWAEYKPMPYGSTGNIFKHPAPFGYWVDDPTGQPHMYTGGNDVRITQYSNLGDYDLSEIHHWVFDRYLKVW